MVYERVIGFDYAALLFTSDFVSMTSSRFSMVMYAADDGPVVVELAERRSFAWLESFGL
jgi:hypothetical protein